MLFVETPVLYVAGMESPDITAVKQFVQSIEDALLFVTMMVIAEGWGVVRCHIKHYRWTSLLCKKSFSPEQRRQVRLVSVKVERPHHVTSYSLPLLGCPASCSAWGPHNDNGND